jgi:hypothetical protein
MEAKVLKRFRDKHTGEIHIEGTTITVTKERLDEILSVGPLVEPIKPSKKSKTQKKE